MIRFATNKEKHKVWNMWKTCFGDSDSYMQLYFDEKYRPENTLLYVEDNEIVASLQMLSYCFTFHGVEIPVIYLSGVCTLPDYRQRGYTRELLFESFSESVNRRVPLMLLVPQERWLVDLYAKYGFAITFDEGKDELPSLKWLMEKHGGDLGKAYLEFDGQFRNKDMTVQKTLRDFTTIVDEGILFDFPEKKSLLGMSRVIDVKTLLSIFASQQSRHFEFSITVKDDLINHNNGSWTVSGGEIVKGVNPNVHCLELDIDDLAQLLLGYHTSIREYPYRDIFPEKLATMHFMLE